MILFYISLITSLNGKIVQEELISTYEIQSSINICEQYIKPAFEQTRKADPYVLVIKAECVKQ